MSNYPEYDPHVEGLYERIAKQEDRIEKLEAALEEAIEDIQDWSSFADDYFKEKWDLAGDLAKHRRALEGSHE